MCSSFMSTRAAFFPSSWKIPSSDNGDWSGKEIRYSVGFSFDVSYFELKSRERLRPPCKLRVRDFSFFSFEQSLEVFIVCFNQKRG